MGMMDTRDEKNLYEGLDAMSDTLDQTGQGGGFVEFLKLITGTTIVDLGMGALTPVWDPDTQREARRVVLRWMRDRGCLRRG
jgi:hypothetical protein